MWGNDGAWRGYFILKSTKFTALCRCKALAKWSHKSMQVESLQLHLAMTCVYTCTMTETCVLAMTELWPSSNLHANECKFFTVWLPNASRCKLVSALLSLVQVHTCKAKLKWLFCNLWTCVYLRVRLATNGKLVLSCHFRNLHWLLFQLFGQGLTYLKLSCILFLSNFSVI